MTSPAQVSGPGALSKRTDTGGQPIRSLPDPKYGEAQEFRAVQRAAPLSDSGGAVPAPPYPSDIARMGQGGPQVPPGVSAPSEPLPGLFDAGDPEAYVTEGAALGPGATSVAGLPGGGQFNPESLRSTLMQYAAADPTNQIANLANFLSERGWL